MDYFLGIDVSSETLDYCLLDSNGEVVISGGVPNSLVGMRNLVSQLGETEQTCVVFESTGAYGKPLGAYLASRMGMVCEVNPKLIKNAATTMTSTKTDAVDAKAIARAARSLSLTALEVLERARITGKERYDLELWLGEYRRLRRAIVRLQRQRDCVTWSPAKSKKSLLRRLDGELGRLQESRKEVVARIEELGAGEDFELILSIKGIGKLTAAALVCKIGNIDRFESADKLKSYFGEYPTLRRSGKRAGQERVALHGNSMIRDLLWNCAKPASVHNPACRALYKRLLAQGKPAPYAWTAVARKLLQIVYGVLKSRTPWDPAVGCPPEAKAEASVSA